MVNLVPDHRVWLSGGAGRADGEDESAVPGHDKQLQDLEFNKKKKQKNKEEEMYNEGKRAVLDSGAAVEAYLPAFLVVRQVAVSREPSRTELLPGVGVLIGLVKM